MGEGYPHTVRESTRAKRARLTVSPRQGLVVVIPTGYDRSRVPTLIEGKRAWLDKTFRTIEAQRDSIEDECCGSAPRRLRLRGIGEEWSVDYEPGDSDRLTLRETDGARLVITGGTSDVTASHEVLTRWLKRKARNHLGPWLRGLADERGFAVRDVSVRLQRTRWASCSKHGRINLNVKLLFLPRELTDHVLLHELCHTVHLNHSKAFWWLVSKHQPDHRQKDAELRAAWRYVPAWLDR